MYVSIKRVGSKIENSYWMDNARGMWKMRARGKLDAVENWVRTSWGQDDVQLA